MTSHRTILVMTLCLCLSPFNAFAHHPGYAPIGGTKLEEDDISSAPLLNSPVATTLGKNNFSGGFTFQYVNYDQIPVREAHELHDEGREIHGKKHEEFYNLHLGYGILEDLDAFLIVPMASRASNQIDDHDALGRDERATGFGDMRLIGKYRFWKKVVEAALVAGIKFPTGETSKRDRSGAKFDPEQQPETGSWDGEFGLALSRSFKKRFSVATSFQYILRTEGGQDFDGGDIFRYDIGGAWSVRPLGEYPNAAISLEFNHEWARRDREKGVKTFDSGGTTVSVTPGLNVTLTRFASAFVAMPIPIYQNPGGRHEEVEYQLLTGMMITV